jgi:hypothetical protein
VVVLHNLVETLNREELEIIGHRLYEVEIVGLRLLLRFALSRSRASYLSLAACTMQHISSWVAPLGSNNRYIFWFPWLRRLKKKNLKLKCSGLTNVHIKKKSREASKLIFFENLKMFEPTKSSHLKQIQSSKKFKFGIYFKNTRPH